VKDWCGTTFRTADFFLQCIFIADLAYAEPLLLVCNGTIIGVNNLKHSSASGNATVAL